MLINLDNTWSIWKNKMAVNLFVNKQTYNNFLSLVKMAVIGPKNLLDHSNECSVVNNIVIKQFSPKT